VETWEKTWSMCLETSHHEAQKCRTTGAPLPSTLSSSFVQNIPKLSAEREREREREREPLMLKRDFAVPKIQISPDQTKHKSTPNRTKRRE
jgi:hypothetical protein